MTGMPSQTKERRQPDPLWGDFGGHCMVGSCRTTPELFLPEARPLGLHKTGSYLLGTWRTEDGTIYRFMRVIDAYESPHGAIVFSSKAGPQLAKIEVESFRGGIRTVLDGEMVHMLPHGSAPFRHSIGAECATWIEGEELVASGSLLASPTHWFNPWRGGGGGYALTTKFRGQATVFGKPAEGFFAHEIHFFPPGNHFLNSPYGWGGREIHWGHMATAFGDGSTVDASLAFGPDGWGFAMLTDENGQFHATTEISISADIRANGYPERILYHFSGEEWLWRIDPKGERPSVLPGGMIGAEGILTRVGETREVVGAMGTIDWWSDGRAAIVPPIG